jgi:antibiotic biosynthesis monooxygenase (ABM) superfamily enzyme
MNTPTLEEQLAEVRRELALRERVYPSLIARGKLKEDQAEKSKARLQATHDTLATLKAWKDAMPEVPPWKASAIDSLFPRPEPMVRVNVVGPNGERLP